MKTEAQVKARIELLSKEAIELMEHISISPPDVSVKNKIDRTIRLASEVTALQWVLSDTE